MGDTRVDYNFKPRGGIDFKDMCYRPPICISISTICEPIRNWDEFTRETEEVVLAWLACGRPDANLTIPQLLQIIVWIDVRVRKPPIRKV